MSFYSVHIVIKEQISASLMRGGGVKSMEVKGDMNLQVSDPACAHIKLALPSPTTDFGSDLQFKQHPNVAKFTPGQGRIVALKDPSRAFPVGQALAVLKWRYAGHDESLVPLSSKPLHTCLLTSTLIPLPKSTVGPPLQMMVHATSTSNTSSKTKTLPYTMSLSPSRSRTFPSIRLTH
jgi:hypothetical protein